MAKPNLVLILTDQHHHEYAGCLGHLQLQTPHVDALAAQGTIFRNAYTPAPICGPARAALYTGQYPLTNGICGNWIPMPEGTPLLTDRLHEAGYYNARVGILGLSPAGAAHGFDYHRRCDSAHGLYDPDEATYSDYLPWAARELGVSVEDLKERAGASERCGVDDPRFWLGWEWVDDEHHPTTWMGREAARFVQDYDRDQPFFLQVSFFAPHHPYSTCAPWDGRYDPAEVPLPRTLHTPHPGDPGGCHFDWPEELWRQMIARYCGSLSMVDREVGRICEALRARGRWDDTLLVFAADHGDHMGEYARLGKGTMLESSVRVPLIVKPPGEGTRQERTEIANLLDLHYTCLDYAGVEPTGVAGRSLRGLVEGREGTWAKETFSTFCDAEAREGVVMYVRDELKLTAKLEGGALAPELYELTADHPDSRNLRGDAAYAAVGREMRETLVRWLRERIEERQKGTI